MIQEILNFKQRKTIEFKNETIDAINLRLNLKCLSREDFDSVNAKDALLDLETLKDSYITAELQTTDGISSFIYKDESIFDILTHNYKSNNEILENISKCFAYGLKGDEEKYSVLIPIPLNSVLNLKSSDVLKVTPFLRDLKFSEIGDVAEGESLDVVSAESHAVVYARNVVGLASGFKTYETIELEEEESKKYTLGNGITKVSLIRNGLASYNLPVITITSDKLNTEVSEADLMDSIAKSNSYGVDADTLDCVALDVPSKLNNVVLDVEFPSVFDSSRNKVSLWVERAFITPQMLRNARKKSTEHAMENIQSDMLNASNL